MIVLFCILVILSQSFGQLISKGKCPQPNPVANFDEKKLISIWTDGWRINNTYEPDCQCTFASFTIEDYLTQYLSGITPIAAVAINWVGKFIPKDECQPGVYHVPFQPYASDSGFDTVTYTHADWDSWFIQYGCNQRGYHKSEYVWVYVKDINDCDFEAITESVESLGISIDHLVETDHKRCPDKVCSN